jgi:hypothetical protein
MKTTWLILFIVVFFTATAIAGESEGLSQQAMESVQQQTREMSALGIPEAQAQKMLTQMVQIDFRNKTGFAPSRWWWIPPRPDCPPSR